MQQLLDEHEIERLILDYSWYLGQKDFGSYGRLFSDGVILNAEGQTIASGEQQIAKLARSYLGRTDGTVVRYVVSNIRIDVAADGKSASADSFLTTIEAKNGQPAQIFRIARYNDVFSRRSGQWKFTSRQEITDWVLKERETN